MNREKSMRTTAKNTDAAVHAIIQGFVQGVGFRYSAMHKARSLALKGWVKNLDNGDVEIWAEGSSAAISAFEDWLAKGPPGARVDRLLSTPRSPLGQFSDFEIETDGW